MKASAEDVEWLYPGVAAADVAREWVASGAGLAVITDGDAGALGVTAHATVEIPAVSTRVVDTVGAGDTFMGTLLDGILNIPATPPRCARASADWTLRPCLPSSDAPRPPRRSRSGERAWTPRPEKTCSSPLC